MGKFLVIMAAVVVGAVLLLASAYSQEDMTVVDNSWFDAPRRPPAVFDHDSHNETADLTDCAECHHVYENGVKSEYDSSEGQACGECHELEDVGRQPGLMRAFHLKCKGCHLERRQGPVVCGACHVQ
jgi:cytochrome c553